MALTVVFSICAFIALVCFVLGVRDKRRNYGLLVMTACLFIGDIICVILTGSKGIAVVRRVMSAYYLIHVWYYFSSVLMIIQLAKNKKFRLAIIPTAVLTLYENYMILSNYFSHTDIIRFSKRVIFGASWWVAEKTENNSAFWGFGAFRGILFDITVIIILTSVLAIFYSPKIYRNRFFVIILIEGSYALIEFIIQRKNWPVWIPCLFMTPVIVVYLYISVFYSVRKLKTWSLSHFANEMNDGFILYDEFDNILVMNKVLKVVLNDELIENFKHKSILDAWLENRIEVEGIEVLVIGNDDKEIYYDIKKNELKDKDAYLGTIYILHDTTDLLMKLSAMREANEELEKAARMKSDFLANMSHEIRTPMNAVIGMAELSLREELPDKVADYIAQIQSSGKNLLNIINDILDFSKIEAGKMEILPDRYEPLSELNDIANILINRIGEKPIELLSVADTSIPHALLGDSMRIRQILINLANNAIKFTDAGVVGIYVSGEKINDDHIMMTYHVRDTGHGIKQEDLNKLFESFQQVDSKRNRSVEGTGLGLAISKRLVEAMEGTIGVTSEYGVGSDFYFSIPQKVLDPTRELVVKDAENIMCFGISDNPKVNELFVADMARLGVEAKVINKADEYKPSGKKDFILFERKGFARGLKDILRENPQLTGVTLEEYDSSYIPEFDNIVVYRRPQSTLTLVKIFNGDYENKRVERVSKNFSVDFICPDAKILIVDDNAINITIAEGLLQPLRAQTFGATSGKEAIEKIKKEDFDIIFMDHMMPEMDGVECTHIIRQTIPKAINTPIIALTANVVQGVKEMFIAEGMNDFVSKPIDVRDIIQKISYWLPKEKLKKREEDFNRGADSQNSETDAANDPSVKFSFLNTEKAIATLGSAALYDKVVREYQKAGDTKIEEIMRAYNAEDWEDYTIKVHALKSSSRQIGALELGNMAEKLEKAGKNFEIEYIRGENEKCLDEYRMVLARIWDAISVEEFNKRNREKKEIAESDLLEALDKLKEAADNLDMDQMEAIRDFLAECELPEKLSARFDELSKAVDDIDSDVIMGIIDEFKTGS